MLVNHNDPVLHNPCEPFNFENPQIDPAVLADKLIGQKTFKNGLGLAAPQIGYSLRVFAFLDEVAFNPEILDVSDDYVLSVEGCLSYPGLWIQIKRPKLIEVDYLTEEGKPVTRPLNDLETRVFLHELDHLDGVTFIDKASDLKLRRAIEQSIKHGYIYSYKELRNQ